MLKKKENFRKIISIYEFYNLLYINMVLPFIKVASLVIRVFSKPIITYAKKIS